MSDEIADMQGKLDELARRIDQRQQDMEQRGVFSDAHAAFVSGLKARHAHLAGRLKTAASEPRLHWRGIRDELVRDYNSLVDEFGRLVDHLDTEAMKPRRR
jgi:hypothetical protein